MRVERRNPDLAYVSADLWLPKNQMNVDAVKSALILQVSKGKGVETVVKMWRETEHHLIVPREMYDLAEITGQFRTVDVRPRTYTRTYVKSRITLDAKSPEFTTQRDSVAAMMRSHGGVLQLGCGLGKSVVALEVIARLQVPALIVVDTTQLIKQWGGEIRTFLDVPGGVGLLQGKVHDWKKAVCITTYQTLSALADDLPEGMGSWFGAAFYDECFPAGTLVDGKPIESYHVGDEVTSFSPTTGFRRRRVAHVFRSQAKTLRTITLVNGEQFTCTDSHPVLGITGWVHASCLRQGDAVGFRHEPKALRSVHNPVSPKVLQPEMLPNVLQAVLRRAKERTVREETSSTTQGAVSMVRSGGHCNNQEREECVLQGRNILLGRTRGAVPSRSMVERYAEDERQGQGRDCASDAREQSDAETWGTRTSPPNQAGERYAAPSTPTSRGKWATRSCTSTDSVRVSGAGVGARVHGRYRQGSEGEGVGIEVLDRHCERGETHRCGGGRGIPPRKDTEGPRREEGQVFGWERVESVQVHERGSDGGFGEVCPTGEVFNLEVEEDHTYTVGGPSSGVVVHNCHHLGAEMFSRSANVVSGRRYGLTATPDRVDGTTRLYFSHLGKILHKDLRTDLQPTVVFYKTGIALDLGEVSVRSEVCDVNGEVHHGKLSSYLGRHKGRTEIVLAEIRKARAEGRRCLILSYSVEELVNLFAAWSGVPGSYSEIPPPTAAEAGVTVPPEKLTAAKLNNQIKSRNVYKGKLARATGADREPLLFALKQVEYTIAKHNAALTMERAWDKRKDAYVQRVVAGATDAGLMIGDVHVDKRTKFLEEKKVVFAIMKYGREALNQPLLDTIIACESVGQEGALRQLLGRALRKREGKRSAVAVFFEDEIGLCIGMCRKLRRFLADNPQDAGGPIKFHIVNHDVKDNFWKRLA